MTKRLFDLSVAAAGLLVSGPVLLAAMLAVWLQDFRSPFYVAPRVGLGGKLFKMVKLRTMVEGADRSGVDSTSQSDPRITPVGRFIRACKLDELPQLWNVFAGDMSLVGPRPNVPRETALYTSVENGLLSVKPGITDFSSIVFSDEGTILKGRPDPDLSYHQLIRPWKSRLGLFYVNHDSFFVDVQLIFWTAVAIVSRTNALRGVQKLLGRLGAPSDLCRAAGRLEDLVPLPPPGMDSIVTSRQSVSKLPLPVTAVNAGVVG